MKRVPVLVALAVAASMALPGAVSAAPPSVSITGVTVSGGTGSVSGTAVFGALGAQSVVNEESVRLNGQIAESPIGEAAGIRLNDATISPIAGGLRFTWHLDTLPEHFPPEVVRYTWAFKIGSNTYQLIAKRTNMLSITTADDPLGHAERLASQKPFFQVRGACGPYRGTSVGGCYHLGFLEGSYDFANKRVSMDVPYEAKDPFGRIIMPDFKPGATLEDSGATNVGYPIIAGLQHGPLTLNNPNVNSMVSRTISGVSSYYVGPQIALGVASPGQDPSTVAYSVPGALSGNTFSGTVSGLTASKNTVYARACNGTECSYSTFKAL